MKATELHFNNLKKQIPKLVNGNHNTGSKNVIFRSDSKGRCLLPYFTNTRRINLIYRGGSKITDSFMQDYTLNRIKHTPNPIVVLFFGTCELTNKQGKFIYIPQNIDERVDQIIEQYIDYKRKILEYNSDAIVIFLDCPYFSLVLWNFRKKHPSPGLFEQDQKKLEAAILTLNGKLKDLNGDRAVPRLAKDFMYSIKKKNKPIKRFRNYNLLYDGVHANCFLAKLWALRINRMISLA